MLMQRKVEDGEMFPQPRARQAAESTEQGVRGSCTVVREASALWEGGLALERGVPGFFAGPSQHGMHLQASPWGWFAEARASHRKGSASMS